MFQRVLCMPASQATAAGGLATALKAAGADFVALAGHPGERRDELAAAGVNLAPEYQAVMKLFCSIPKCYELQASNRFKDTKLRDLMAFLRKPGKQVPPAIRATWNAMQLKSDDRRLREERFQNGHMIVSYWDTVARWITCEPSGTRTS